MKRLSLLLFLSGAATGIAISELSRNESVREKMKDKTAQIKDYAKEIKTEVKVIKNDLFGKTKFKCCKTVNDDEKECCCNCSVDHVCCGKCKCCARKFCPFRKCECETQK